MAQKMLSRRSFLKAAGLSGAGAILASCARTATPTPELKPTQATDKVTVAPTVPPTAAPKAPDEIRVMLGQFAGATVTEQVSYIEGLICERLNIKFKKAIVPGDVRIEKRNVMMAGGELDYAFGAGLPDYYDLISRGQLLDLTDLLPAKAPNYWPYVDDTMKKYIAYKGRVYGLIGPAVPLKFGEPPRADKPSTWVRTAMRKDWLEKLGLQPPKNIDEFFDVAKAFYDQDPGGVGKDNIIPIVACNGFVWNNLDFAFGAYGVQYNTWYLDEADQTVKSYDVHPGMKDALAWLQKAYAANLIDKDFITQKEPQMLDKIKNGYVGVFSSHYYPQWIGGGAIFHEMEQLQLIKEGSLKEGDKFTPDTDNPPTYWTYLEPPTGPNGDSGYPGSMGYSGVWPGCIPRNAKNVDAVLKLWDFLATEEGYLLLNYGVKDKDYVMTEDKGPQPGPAVGDKDFATYRQEIGCSQVPQGWNGFGSTYPGFAQKYEWATSAYSTERAATKYGVPAGKFGTVLIYDMALQWARPKYVNFTGNQGLSAPSAGQLSARLAATRDEYCAKIVTGAFALDKFDEFVARWQADGGDTLVNEYTEAYKAKLSE